MGKPLEHSRIDRTLPDTLIVSVASAALSCGISLCIYIQTRIGIVKQMTSDAMRFKRTLTTALITNQRFGGVNRPAQTPRSLITVKTDTARFTRPSAFYIFCVLRIVRMTLWAMRLLSIDCRDANASMVIDLARHRLNMVGIDASGNSAQMIAMQIQSDRPDKERVQQTVERVEMPLNTHQGVLMRLVRMPKPARAFVTRIFNGDMGKQFCEQFSGNLNTVIIKGGHMLKHSPLVCGLVYGVDAS